MNYQRAYEKAKELISNLTIQLVTPEPTTAESEYKRVELVCAETKLRAELTQIESMPETEEKPIEYNLETKVLDEIHKALSDGRRLLAVKIHFEATGNKSLKDSKRVVDEIWKQIYKNQ